MNAFSTKQNAGFTLTEAIIASVIGGVAILIVFSGAMSMQRCFVASEDLVVAKQDQTRLSDYLAMDLRRAFSITIGTDGTTIVTMTMPDYYDSTGKPRTPTITKYVCNYGDPAKPMTVTYLKKNGVVYRQEGAATPLEIARDVEDFQLSVNDLKTSADIQVTFQPRFQRNPTAASLAAARTASTLNSTVILRNKRKDIK